MTSTDRARVSSPLDLVLDVFRIRQYFNGVVRARDVASAAVIDLRFLGAVRRGLVPLPCDRRTPPARVVGVARALEETGPR